MKVLQGFLSRAVIAGNWTLPNRIYDGLAHMTLHWWFFKSLLCFPNRRENTTSAFLKAVLMWVGGKLTYTLINSGFGAAFHTFPPCFCHWWAHIQWFSACTCGCQPPARVGEDDQREDKVSDTHMHQRCLSFILLSFLFAFSLVASCSWAGCQTLPPIFRPRLSLCAHSLALSLYCWVRWHMQL